MAGRILGSSGGAVVAGTLIADGAIAGKTLVDLAVAVVIFLIADLFLGQYLIAATTPFRAILEADLRASLT